MSGLTPAAGSAPPFPSEPLSQFLTASVAMVDRRMKVMDCPPGMSYAERRSHRRYSFTAAVQAVDIAQRSVLNARISDLGRGGCYIDAISLFPWKTGVRLRITSAKRCFEALPLWSTPEPVW